MELIIDDVRCDLTHEEPLSWSWNSNRLRSVGAQRQGWSYRMKLPISPTNSALFLHADQPHAAYRFNHTNHRARLLFEGMELLAGTVDLVACRPETPEAGYEIVIHSDTANWAHAAATNRLEELDIDFEMVLDPTEITKSWSNESPVRFLPIVYDDYSLDYPSGSLLPSWRMLSPDNYHPFLHAATLVRSIVEQQGYKLCSRFVESELFRKLYISGAYPQRQVDAKRKRYDFLARRLADVSAVCDFAGRVGTTPGASTHTIGNIVDAFTPGLVDAEGGVLTDCFSANRCLKMEDGELVYRPTSEIEVGFQFDLSYTTDYRILSRTRLAGFDSVFLGGSSDFRFELVNRFEDRRTELVPGQEYRLVIFDHTGRGRYRLLLPDGSVAVETSDRTALITLPETELTGHPTLFYEKDGGWLRYEKDWALYDGYISETGRIAVEITLTTPPESIGPSHPKYFSDIYFYGAEQGMSLTLSKQTALRPLFSGRPGVGSHLDWSSVSALGIYQGELLDALGHLFNWRIFTDEEHLEVYIEPEGEFYDEEELIDWRDRVVEGEESVVHSTDCAEHGTRIYGYAAGDGAVERLNSGSASPFGQWTTRMESKSTLRGVERLYNPLFSATLNRSNCIETAPTASLPVVGDRDDTASVEELRFTPRILRYEGLRALPEGERWSFPAPEGLYPFAAFHFAGDDTTEGFTLCFEDRDGVTGLHRFYDNELLHRNQAQQLTTTLLLTPWEVAALRSRSEGQGPGVERLYRLKWSEEPVRARLEELESYDPASCRARCRFTLLCDDRP